MSTGPILSTEQLRRQKPSRKEFSDLTRSPIHVIADNLTSGFNVGGIFRTSDAFRLAAVHLCGTTPVPPTSAIKKTSMGTERWVPWQYHRDASEALDECKRQGSYVVAVELAEKAVPLDRFRPAFPLVLVLGDEMLGISPEVMDQVDTSVVIPMYGMGNSLDVVAAFSIVAYTVSRYLQDGLRIHELRMARGWGLRELARRSGVAFSTVQAVEAGNQIARRSTLHKLYDALEDDLAAGQFVARPEYRMRPCTDCGRRFRAKGNRQTRCPACAQAAARKAHAAKIPRNRAAHS